MQNKNLAFYKKEIIALVDELNKSSITSEEKKPETVNSVNYAKLLQEMMLPPESLIKKYFPESFIFYKPKELVSGDFYWFSAQKEEVIVAAIDCTGHGIQGAFISMVANTLLKNIVEIEKTVVPCDILKKMHVGIMSSIKNNSCKEFDLDSVKSVYMLSDGYYDQFGGNNNTKFLSSRFQDMITDNQNLSMTSQYNLIVKTFNEWRGSNIQIDDVMVLGIGI